MLPGLLAHICTTIACNTGTKAVGVTPGILRHVKSNPVKLGLETTPLVIKSHTSVASFATTSLTVSPLQRSIQAISGPCHMTQLEDILLQPLVVALELVGIINIFFTIMYLVYALYTYIIYKNF